MSKEIMEQPASAAVAEDKPGSLHPAGSALQFKIGDRLYWITRNREGLAWQIVANGDIVDRASILHYGDVPAFLKIANRLQDIENQWAAAC